MVYEKLWQKYDDFIPYELQMSFDIRLCNVVNMLNYFFQDLLVRKPSFSKVNFYLAGSCIKKDTFRDIDMIFPSKEMMSELNQCLDQSYFEYENNSMTYKFNDEIFQLVFRPKFENKSLEFTVSSFDFDSTKIGFECCLDIEKKEVEIVKGDIRKEFITYIDTKVNNLCKISVNPFVSLQRAIHFLKRGDEVPYSVFLDICSSIADIKIKENEDINKHFQRLQGNPKKLENIKEAITEYIEDHKNNK
ncbi:hypothetical protein CPU12_11615 [Malaciobacter molluscorum LMG 25693]|uniref:Uncharacterized protein n=1 Tax=Malaciobacter molluscorum LMG 25693 TaxID=870501 RepID=A0A2G1DFH3_9BACT|nr:hypothetical protein [Malaciobacter molluscorum]AXX91763.1 hypothetical protein AMOL_0767 [Malaciobacter molluscorum LMG 25693]PHO17241.1 hypothetical protein CPU12_11615 [Malaciobacter molluscorum LMG 25693]RXJ92900.1 hypothetical protein CRV00_12200 [Malaciobacter molluscorum]